MALSASPAGFETLQIIGLQTLCEEFITKSLNAFCNPATFSSYVVRSNADPSSDDNELSLQPCGAAILQLLQYLCLRTRDRKTHPPSFIIGRLDDLLALAKENFYAFPYNSVPFCWRELFRVASFMKICVLATQRNWLSESGEPNETIELSDHTSTPPLTADIINEIVETIDTAIIMAGSPASNTTQDTIDCLLELLEKIDAQSTHSEPHDILGDNTLTQPSSKRQKTNHSYTADQFPESSVLIPTISKAVPELVNPSFGKFERHMLYPYNNNLGPEPLIIPGVMEHWPARAERPWDKPSYLMSRTIGGRRLVPIELGRSYVDSGWGQKIIPFREFLEHYMMQDPTVESHGVGYLAQHNLFSQIPTLRNDICVPDYCFATCSPPHHSSPLFSKHTKMAQLEEPLLNAWFGPAGTISPLHTDPYHNILAQVVGKKYIRLYAPRESEKLYPRGIEGGGVDMSNTSELDVGTLIGWDGTEEERALAHRKFPLFALADYVECVLEEGQCLYIPLGWWHYVRSLSPSCSVSFWFNSTEEHQDNN
ncbi:hypothetical protein HYFRA_00002528 [Hymenoscyphus fraxineus]|uniref:JmjC domain-containing protein n=1 Tax=Hymenoscyphus fraxineus TaxID=746836 RepID=A0A9N9L7P3_9HELO|nr:hypothetical protein HYFRA_00002528 [Hymenoscyphus fraxineus]